LAVVQDQSFNISPMTLTEEDFHPFLKNKRWLHEYSKRKEGRESKEKRMKQMIAKLKVEKRKDDKETEKIEKIEINSNVRKRKIKK